MPRSVTLVLLLTACAPPASGADGGAPVSGRSDPAAYVRGAHPSLVVELDVAPGLAPRAGVIDTVTGVIAPLLDKPEGIAVVRDGEIPAERLRAEWTFDDVRALADESFDGLGREDQAVMHTMWLPGRYLSDGGGTVLGVAWSNRHVAIFADAIASSCSGLLPAVRDRVCLEAEAAVWTHEIGHVIGLVNNGIPMVAEHEDGAHEGHTTDEDDVMYWAYEGATVGDLLAARLAGGSGPLFEFGPLTLADVAAFRDGG